MNAEHYLVERVLARHRNKLLTETLIALIRGEVAAELRLSPGVDIREADRILHQILAQNLPPGLR